MQKLSLCLLGFGAIGSLLGAFWSVSAERGPVRSAAVEERDEPAARPAPPRVNRAVPRPATNTNVAAAPMEAPAVTAQSLIEQMSESDDEVDVVWEERLSQKPQSVIDFFNQKSATFAEWARAYRADICACSSFECITALQDDFVSRNPPFSDMHEDEATKAEFKAAVKCTKPYLPESQQTAALGR